MTPFKIGNWLVTEQGINWDGKEVHNCEISKDRILEFGTGNRRNMYDWLVHLPSKTWITEADTYSLNTAFIYAVEHYGLEFTSNSFVQTLIEQQKVLQEKES